MINYFGVNKANTLSWMDWAHAFYKV